MNHLYGGCSLLGAIISVASVLRGSGEHSSAWAPLSLAGRFDVLLELSIAILIVHALLWVGLERLFGWDYSTGPTPKGLHAAIMSLSLTLPALAVPIFYEKLTARIVLPGSHLHGALLSVAGGAIAYMTMFGVDDQFPGVREFLLLRFRQSPLRAEILATLAYAFILVILVATPYRLLIFPLSPVYVDLGWPALASLVTFFGLSAYLLLRYPDSLNTSSKWGFLRGIIAGMFTVVSVCTALYA
jgi:hypothetical protein